MKPLVAGLIVCWLAATPAMAAPQPAKADGIVTLLRRVESALQSGEASRYLELLSPVADRERAEIFAASVLAAGVSRVSARERDRAPLFGTLPGDGYQLMVEVLTESGSRARLATWRLDVRRLAAAPKVSGKNDDWAISNQVIVSSMHGLLRLALNPQRQYAARNFVVESEDLQLALADGSVFVADAGGAPGALVLVGRGDMTFSPAPATERGQVKIFTGSETLQTPFDAAYVRASAFDLAAAVAQGTLSEQQVDPREFKRADEVFRAEVAKSFVLDLSDMSPEIWSLPPQSGDLLAEVRTKRFDTLTYALSSGEPEDVALFDRRRRRNIALYPSAAKQADILNGFDEDEGAQYEVLHYDLDVSLVPDREMISGRTRMKIRVREPMLTTLTIRLAEPLAVQSIVAEEFGRLMAIRVRNQNSVVVSLPDPLASGVELSLVVSYAGRLAPVPTDREIISLQYPQMSYQDEPPEFPLEETYLYSNRSYWYAQSPTSDYATASIRLTVPAEYLCTASGTLVASISPAADGRNPRAADSRPRTYVFGADQPVRYLSFLATRLVAVRSVTVRMGEPPFGKPIERPTGSFHETLALSVLSQPRMQSRARQVADRAVEVLRFYSSIVGDFPYATLSLAVVEAELPGGHSPAYMTVINQPSTASKKVWREDPASFEDFPEFFIAHEVAHQWWGHAVGWKNYHEQWLSEGFAQYFAALYAERVRGRAVFDSVIRRMRRWAMDESSQGPISLGYRVGHIKGEGRLFRAVIYNKSAVVLHMLRRFIGDEAFFRGIRRFYLTWRFQKAGTLDLQRALEAESGISLRRFFERWVYDTAIPQVKVSSTTEAGAQGEDVVVRFEQIGDTFDLPVTLTVEAGGRPAFDVLVKLKDQIQEVRLPLRGPLRRIDVNRDDAAIAEFIRQQPAPPRPDGLQMP